MPLSKFGAQSSSSHQAPPARAGSTGILRSARRGAVCCTLVVIVGLADRVPVAGRFDPGDMLSLDDRLTRESRQSASPSRAPAVGDLLVAPTRVVFEGRLRSAHLTLINTGAERTTYRIFFTKMRMTQTGELEEIEIPDAEERLASRSRIAAPHLAVRHSHDHQNGRYVRRASPNKSHVEDRWPAATGSAPLALAAPVRALLLPTPSPPADSSGCSGYGKAPPCVGGYARGCASR